jgi:hypothetical protein
MILSIQSTTRARYTTWLLNTVHPALSPVSHTTSLPPMACSSCGAAATPFCHGAGASSTSSSDTGRTTPTHPALVTFAMNDHTSRHARPADRIAAITYLPTAAVSPSRTAENNYG